MGDDENPGSVLSYQLMRVREANDSNTQEMNLFTGSEGWKSKVFLIWISMVP